MKKSSKRIPKSYLPKYSAGIKTPVTRTLANGNEVSYAEDNVDMGGGTQNIYNQKRSFGNNIGQYAGYAQATLGTASALSDINNQGYDGNTKNYAQSQAVGNGITQAIGTINPLIAMGTGIRKSATEMVGDKSGAARTVSNWMAAPHEAAVSDISAANNSENTQSQKIGGYMSAIGDITGMSKMRQMFSYGTGNDEKTTGFWGKYNDLTGITARNNQKNSLEQNQFAFGGEVPREFANSEIEKQENVVDPNGSFLQVDGSTHENGGVPVALPGNSMIFSDRLKLGKKTFAELNKVNNTNKEDKILESNKFGNTSKRTAELMKFAKNKNSEELFGAQEALKQAKVEAYAKKMGVVLPQAQEAPEEGMQYPMGGKLPTYPDGGPIDTLGTKVDAPPANYNFLKNVGNKQVYVDPGFIRKAPGSTFKSDPNNWNKFLIGQLQNGVSPDELAGKGYGTKEGLNPLMKYYKPRYAYIEPLGKPSTTPTNTQMPYDQRIDRKEVSQNMSTDVNYYDYPDANAGYSKATRVAFDRNSGREIDPMKSYDPKGNYTPYFNLETGRDLYKNTIKSSIPGTNPNNVNLNNKGDLRKEAIQSGSSFKYGGRKLPKYGNGVKFVPKMASEDQDADIVVPGSTVKSNPDFTEVLGPDSYNTFGKPLDTWEAARLNKSTWDADYLNNPNAARPVNTDENNKTDWQGIAANIAMGLANNAGNIYDLARYNKPEVEKYERMKATYLDPSAALRDAEAQTRRAEYNVRGASGGNAGTYLANRVGLNAQNIMTKDRIRQQYANANAGISNSVGQYNNELSRQEVIANAQNRARTRSGKGEAIGSMGSNIANQMMDNKKSNMDQETLQLMMKYYDTPEFQRIMKNYKGKK